MICALGGFYFGFAALRRSLSRDGRQDGAILTEIGYLKGGIDDIKRELKENDKRYVELLLRIQRLEQTACHQQ